MSFVGLLPTIFLLAISGARCSIQNEEVWEAILYGYIIDYNSPAYLARGDLIFDVPNKDAVIAISANPQMKMEVVYSTSEHTAAENFAVSAGVKGSYGAFSMAASMSVSRSSDSSIKTVRLDSIIKALKYEVSAKSELRTFPQNFLTENFKNSVRSLPVEKIEELIGSFYARRLDLGGEVKKSYIMQATESDTQSSVTAEIEASYGSSMMGGSVSTSTTYGTREANSDAEMSSKWYVKGGDTTVWLGKDFSGADAEVAAIQDEWADTINDANLHAFNYELGMMWDLVKAVDHNKGVEFQRYLENKWGDQANMFDPSHFLQPDLLEGIYIVVSDRKDASSSGNLRIGVKQGGTSCETARKTLPGTKRDSQYWLFDYTAFGSCAHTPFNLEDTIEIQIISDSGDSTYLDEAGIRIDGLWLIWIDHNVKVNINAGDSWRVVYPHYFD